MFRRRSTTAPPADVAHAFGGFRRTVDQVEEAKGALVAAVPRGRGEGVPLAEAVAGFEVRLAEARDSMGTWRVAPVEGEWRSCRDGLDEASKRAEALRLEGSPQGYEELAPALAQLMEPLEAFETAWLRFRRLGA